MSSLHSLSQRRAALCHAVRSLESGKMENLFFTALHRVIVIGILIAGGTALALLPDAIHMQTTSDRLVQQQ